MKVLSDEQHEQANQNNYNFDHPDAFDFDLVLETLKNLKMGKQVGERSGQCSMSPSSVAFQVEIPLYNFTTHSREAYTVSCVGPISFLRLNQPVLI